MRDESRWVQQAREGDHSAFEALVRLHIKGVYHLALGHTGNHHDAEEITQVVFLKAWKGLKDFRGEAAFSTWLYRLTRNACTDHFRQNKKRRGDLSLDDPDLPVLPHDGPSPQEEAERRETQEDLRKALDALPEHHRAILLLREMEGLSYQELAQVLEVEVGTVKSRLARARKALVKHLRETGNLWEAPPSNHRKGGMEDERL